MPSKTFVIIALIACTGILMGTLTTEVLVWRYMRAADHEQEICHIDETKLTDCNDPDMKRKQIFKNDKDTHRGEHCQRIEEFLYSALRQKVNERYDSVINPEYIRPELEEYNCQKVDPEQARLHIQQIKSHAKQVKGRPTQLFWSKATGAGEELQYHADNGSIYIRQSGLYHVSFHLTTLVKNGTSHSIDDEHSDIRHFVHIMSHATGTEEVLLENAESRCHIAAPISEVGSNIGAAFRLEEQDRLYVSTFHPHLIVSEHNSDHFSIYKL